MGPEPQLRVRIVNDEIVVSLPGFHYSATYYKPFNAPQLVESNISIPDDPRIGMKKSEFVVKARKLANENARELGWIM